VTAEEFGIFAVAVHCVIDRYMRVRETLAEIARKREEEKNKFKLEAERRKVRDRRNKNSAISYTLLVDQINHFCFVFFLTVGRECQGSCIRSAEERCFA
jgi:hypothetical protein